MFTGTTVSACNLFKNLPVRKQYYSTTKRKKEELKKVEDLVISFGVIWPEVRISLRHNKETVWQKNVVPDYRSVLVSVLSAAVVNKLDHVKKNLPDMEVLGQKKSNFSFSGNAQVTFKPPRIKKFIAFLVFALKKCLYIVNLSD